MDKKDFSKNLSRHLVKIQDGGYSFVPPDLPPEIQPDWELASALSRADRNLSQLAGVARTLPNPHLLIRSFIRREAVLSSRIEGTHASLSDVMKFEGAEETSISGDIKEVVSYITALEYGLIRINDIPMSARLIKELHQILMKDVRGGAQAPGEFRRIQNWIGTTGSTIETATYVPPPINELNNCLTALERFINSENNFPPLIKLGLIHYQFEAIHPFLDGNGRVGRLIIAILLCNWGLLPQPLLYLSAYFEKNRDEYYRGLLSVSQQGNWNAWLVYFLDGVTNQAIDAIGRASELVDLWGDYKGRLQTVRASGMQFRLLDYLFMQPIFSAVHVQKALEITFRSAQQNIDKLVALGILSEVTGKQRNRVFAARAIINIVDRAI
ncbi:MAG: Fic family protein [Cyanobacteria bacterium TGS_CYA1]|nr:Fic family protein [Cyanobacteria bacterium TGS_CYA1]